MENTENKCLAISIIYDEDLMKGSAWGTFDEAMKVVNAFFIKYPEGTEWGAESGLFFEDTIIEFTKNYQL